MKQTELTDLAIRKTKENIVQLLEIGMVNSDANIKEVYGGEMGLLAIIKGYMTVLEDLQGFKLKEQEINNGLE